MHTLSNYGLIVRGVIGDSSTNMPEDVTVKDTSTDTSSINPSTVTHPPKDYRLVNLVDLVVNLLLDLQPDSLTVYP